MTLLQRIHQQREQTRERLRIQTQAALRLALRELVPGQPVVVFGSLIRPGGFRLGSDVDIALYAEPPSQSIFRLQARLEEQLGRRVDVLLLGESRFRQKIEREGEKWMN